MRNFLIAAAILAALATPARADQKDPRLPALFDQLKAAESVETAQPVEQQIWTIWSQSESDDVNLLMGLGVNAMARADYSTALDLFNKMVEVAPNFSEGWNKRATVYYLMGEYEQSRADVAKTLELEPRHFGALSGLGLIYLAEGQNDKALDAFRRALKVNPTMPGPQHWVEELKTKVEGEPI
ncbi:MAG TPA: tetratricopeptide repeat protein [Tepidisphaeraceae bacterium]|jgi:tetratricopeptide (TPR) repeat protein|nr:tetratricopeptide repeat protein [Tepidisphaeraceae bacterium]